jgi:hypothetical protein
MTRHPWPAVGPFIVVLDSRLRVEQSESNERIAMATTNVTIWEYSDPSYASDALVGYEVEALDGGIGKIDEASNDVGASFVVVDTGPWIFGKKVVLPAGVIGRVDAVDEKAFVNRTKEQIKNSPEYDADTYRDDAYRGELGSYYGPGGAGWQD